ncbi:MAG: hypothetical protein HOV79_23165 [Hamadaea sp.]|nr:hypothetical protein [Hamadaea sp.]
MNDASALADLALAPVTITPTKPLTPTHVKGLLWLDVIHKSTREIRRVTYVWNPRMSTLTAQTAAFWEFLDRVVGDVDWSACTEPVLGELYVRSHTEGTRPSGNALQPYFERVEKEGWIHPASLRLLDLWHEQLGLLNVADPGLRSTAELALTGGDVLDVLREHQLTIDHRGIGGPVYLDGTIWGLPVRQIVDEDGIANYLVPVLRELIEVGARHQRVVLVYDQELMQDYVLLDKVLTALGVAVTRLALGRVPIDGVVASSRHGGWEGKTLSDLSNACLEHVDVPTYRLGMRIYFIAMLERGCAKSFQPDLLRRSMHRAQRILGEHGDPDDSGESHAFLRRLATHDGGYVDPYRLTTALLDRRRKVPADLLATVFG